MDLFLFIAGAVAMLIAIGLLIMRLFTREPKKKLLILLAAGFLVLITGALIGGANMTPEEMAANKEQRLAKAEGKETKLEAERLEKEEDEEAKQNKLDEIEKKKVELIAKEKDAAEALKVENEQTEKLAEEKDEKDEEATAEKKKAVEEKKNAVPLKSKNIIYDVFKSGDDKIDETITHFEFDENEKVLTATVKGKDGWSEKSIGLGFYEDSTAIYRELSKDERIVEIWLTITFPMKDTYGKTEDEEVMSTWMSRETLDKVNWKSFDYQKLLDVVDGKRIYPQFVQ